MFAKKINEEFENRFEGALYGKLKDYPNLSRVNAWYSLNPPERPFMLLCHGIQVRDPQMRFENGRFIVRANIANKAFNMEAWCDHQGQELVDLDPRLLPADNNDHPSKQRFLETYRRYE